ncbi:MAG: Plug domain-containing protein, partial [Panacibacter sp.]
TVSQKTISKSRFLFVDLVNDKDSVIKQLIFDAASKQISSHIQFPDSLATGYYWLRAYTKQMAMHDTSNIGIKPLYVFGKKISDNNFTKAKKKPVANQDDNPTITFYPEGGNIMTGINSTVALQTTFKTGEPASIGGYVKDNRDTVIARFTTNKNGLAKFDFEPSGYRQYRTILNWNGKEISYPLPAFNFYAGQLSVTHLQGQYKLRILLGDSIYTKDALSYVVGISKDSLVFAGIGRGLCEVTVDEKKLPEGVTTFYLFNKDFKLLSERSVYAKNIQVSVTADKDIYDKHNKVSLSLSITNASQHPIPSLVAVSVSDSLFSYNKEQAGNASFDLHATDNLFSADNNSFKDDEIELIMLAKNNEYQTLSQNKSKSIIADDDSLLYIKGTILSEKNVPLQDKIVMLLSNSGGNDLFYADTTDYAGRFFFPFDKYPDSMQFAMQVKDLTNNRLLNTKVVLDPLAYPKLTTPAALKEYPEIEPKTRQRLYTYYNNEFISNNEKQLPPVTIKRVVDYDESKRVSPYSSILTSRDLDGRTTVDNAIFKISGLQLLNGYLVIRGLNSFKPPGPGAEPLLLVEGAPVALASNSGMGIVSPVMSYLSTLNPKDIDFIEVLKGGTAANYGIRGGNGVILINLSNKIRDLGAISNNMKIFYLKGVSKTSLFPNFIYDQKDKKNITPNDFRSTIFWNGNFLTGDVNNAILTFYTSDVPSIYNITVTGITIYGDIIRKTITIQSK